MLIKLNGKVTNIDKSIPIDVLISNYYKMETGLSVSMNGSWVDKTSYSDIFIQEGDDIKVIYPIIGG